MGRPPIGKRAMTDAERQRKRRAHIVTEQPVTKPDEPVTKLGTVTKPAAPDPVAVEIGRLVRAARDAMPDEIWCHFCGKSQSEVAILVKGLDYNDDGSEAYICDECTLLAHSFVIEQRSRQS